MIEAYFFEVQAQLSSSLVDWKNIRRAYAGRPYHNLDHLNEMLTHLKRHQSAAGADPLPLDPLIFGVALIYHDIVYQPTRADNEARSAQSAVKMLRREGNLSEGRIDRCRRLILSTKKHRPSPDDDGDEALLNDLDLAVLARDPISYDRYADAIRKEFWMFPGFVFRTGRIKTLTNLLDRPHIYHTELGRQEYETPARENLWRELRNL
ncbi:putative metal-dependent HD superfamily phosphohydrolase [Lewinella aquimaris]|uniref:Putative metal-dependent HD superfamily phosphohydrolase n=1 Tax=Neolewinella aquimaris TaxID=1835722 RepID=A0A840E4W8_9BACT|nr:hypothetical protein [Neolewinella aquimaris]MBB4078993.1 putative metal-dependent HD superfamily phosphohydrolase [Neolewinella aquimaris]